MLNNDLMRQLDEALRGREVRFEWVRGHVGHPLNEAADARARAAASAHRRGTEVPAGPGWIPYLARLRVIKLEAALNQIRFATQYLNPRASEQECFELNWLMLNHICVQAGTLDKSLKALEDDIPDSEWSSRRQIATALETLVLPYRLEANFRVNIADGNVSIEFAATPEQVFPSSMPLNGLGIVLSSREVRKRAASVYIQRLAILLAAIAFRSSSKILHVWVAATLDTANRHQCYLSVDFDRWRFSQIDVEKDMDDFQK